MQRSGLWSAVELLRHRAKNDIIHRPAASKTTAVRQNQEPRGHSSPYCSPGDIVSKLRAN